MFMAILEAFELCLSLTPGDQARVSPDSKSAWRYSEDFSEVLIDRFFGGKWHTYGPYPNTERVKG